ncbi:hypothetical protein ACJ73_08289 [Blastomyces percursus]|uniref:Reverse transcriptase zinc-binding domain-containing protein n=1 Tax=Blastomyces percursus TaxID=1658174 RepID=A0A1J9PVP5_9EURO|nr:hypothetical protein ACJ73_08289 [Blastomyces percursus]
MQTSKIALAEYLGSFGAMETQGCHCGYGRQTVAHILLRCPLFINLRNDTLFAAGRESNVTNILRQPAHAKNAAIFIIRTNLLGQFRYIHTSITDTEAEARAEATTGEA